MDKWEYLQLEINYDDSTRKAIGYENGEPNPEHEDLYTDWYQSFPHHCWNYWGEMGWELIDQTEILEEEGCTLIYNFKRQKK